MILLYENIFLFQHVTLDVPMTFIVENTEH